MAGRRRTAEGGRTRARLRPALGARTIGAWFLAAATAACGHDWSVADGGDADAPAEAVAEDGGREDGSAEIDGAGDDASRPEDAGPDGPPPSCGNGVIETGEACDDGNTSNTDACTNACLAAVCGDGFVWAGTETCDPGGPAGVPGCDGDCTAAECGDGVVGILEGLTEDFESGFPVDPRWQNGDPYGFEPTTLYAHGGTTSLGSTNAGHRRTSAWIRVEAASGGEVCFWYMGEPGSDREDEFRFLVGGVTVFTMADAQPAWVRECVTVTPGVHVFEWRYSKGRSDWGGGTDAFYIDDIETGGPFAEECDDGNTSNTDACANGCRAATCGDGYVWAGAEECDGTSASCTTTCGSTGSQTCSGCRAVGSCVPPADVCNGADDDCDTVPDDPFACVSGDSGSCANGCGVPGTQSCGSSCTWSPCCGPTEICQCGTLCDDNCDGLTDEGCPAC